MNVAPAKQSFWSRAKSAIFGRRSNPSEPLDGRAIRARIDGAMTTEENRRYWANADALSADAAYNPAVRRTLRMRARYEFSTAPYAAGIVRTLAEDTIGTGPALQMLTESRADNTAVETSFAQWMEAACIGDKLRTMRQAKAVDGEAFGSFITNSRLDHDVQLDLKLHEAEMITNPALGYAEPRNMLTDGIILDDQGNVEYYTLLRAHPGDVIAEGTGLQFEKVAADDMVHVFNQDRPDQHRGLSEMAPALPLFAKRKQFMLATIGAAEAAAEYSWVMKTTQPPTQSTSWFAPFDRLETERGAGMVLPEGADIFQMTAAHPATTFEMFDKRIIRELCRCFNQPYCVAAGDSSDFNFASGKLDLRQYGKSLRIERHKFERRVLNRMFRKWWIEARLLPGLLPESLRALEVPPPFTWRWEGEFDINPQQEAAAIQLRLQMNLTTLSLEYARMGLDWEEQLEQIAREKEKLAELGLTMQQAAPKPAPANDQTEQQQPVDEHGVPNAQAA